MSGLVTEQMLAGIRDAGFRNRFVGEPRTVRAWSSKLRMDSPSVLDFGCGQGIAALGCAMENPGAQVTGVDVDNGFEHLSREADKHLGVPLPANLAFESYNGRDLPFADASFDLVYSWSVFEHIRRGLLASVITDLRRVLKPDGHLFVQIDPLYFSPRGAHLYPCSPVPWVHLLLPHDELREMVHAGAVRPGGRDKLWAQYESLNRLTVAELRQVLEAGGFRIQRLDTDRWQKDEPPDSLLATYQRDVLETSTVYLLATRDAH